MKPRRRIDFTGKDATDYCRSIGYTGEKPVVVLDGKVVSHNNADWFEFCRECEDEQK